MFSMGHNLSLFMGISTWASFKPVAYVILPGAITIRLVHVVVTKYCSGYKVHM